MGPKHAMFLHPRVWMAGLLMVVGFGAFAANAAAQEEDPQGATPVITWVRLCLEPGCTEMLDLTEPVDGVPVEITDAVTGDVLGTCVTGEYEPGACQVDAGAAESVSILLDESAFPEGYAATGNPGQLDLANGNEYPFLLMPDGGFPPDDGDDDAIPPVDDADDADNGDQDGVSGLPSTGTGTTSGQQGSDTLVYSLAVTAGLGLAGIGARAFAMRQR